MRISQQVARIDWIETVGEFGALLMESQQIKALQVQLAQAQEKAGLFEAVIDVLRKDYGVRIVKKPLGKSSRKTSSQG